jgi:hypothetical protein
MVKTLSGSYVPELGWLLCAEEEKQDVEDEEAKSGDCGKPEHYPLPCF